MRTTVVHRRADIALPDISSPTLRSLPPAAAAVHWSTGKLGLVVSAVAAIVAVALDLATSLPRYVIVLAVMVVAFAVSCRATVRRPYR